MAIEWDGLISALQAGTIDAVIAGQSMTEERLQQVDMAGPYFYASIVCVTKKDSPSGFRHRHLRADRHLHRPDRHHLV